MKSTGIIRRIDDLGRIVIPKDVRRKVRVSEGDPLEIFFTDDEVILKRYDQSKNIIGVLRELKELVLESEGLECRVAALEKIKELAEVLKAESDDKGRMS